MQRLSLFFSLALVLVLAGGGCDNKLKEVTKERDGLSESVRTLKEENDDLRIRYAKARAESSRLQDRNEALKQERAAGKCAIEGTPTWDFKDREFLMTCTGSIKNTGKVPVSNVTVMIVLKDANSEILSLRYSNGQPTRQGIFYVMARERMNEGDVADFTVKIFTRDLDGGDFAKIKASIAAEEDEDRVEIKPLFIQ